jgi:hypothetical protein
MYADSTLTGASNTWEKRWLAATEMTIKKITEIRMESGEYGMRPIWPKNEAMTSRKIRK